MIYFIVPTMFLLAAFVCGYCIGVRAPGDYEEAEDEEPSDSHFGTPCEIDTRNVTSNCMPCFPVYSNESCRGLCESSSNSIPPSNDPPTS